MAQEIWKGLLSRDELLEDHLISHAIAEQHDVLFGT